MKSKWVLDVNTYSKDKTCIKNWNLRKEFLILTNQRGKPPRIETAIKFSL